MWTQSVTVYRLFCRFFSWLLCSMDRRFYPPVSLDFSGTMLQAGRSRVQVPMRSLDFFCNWPNPSSRTMALGSTQPLTEMSTRNILGMFLGVKGGRRHLRADCLENVGGNLNISQPYGPARSPTGIPLLYPSTSAHFIARNHKFVTELFCSHMQKRCPVNMIILQVIMFQDSIHRPLFV
jgi:hypothetical protein